MTLTTGNRRRRQLAYLVLTAMTALGMQSIASAEAASAATPTQRVIVVLKSGAEKSGVMKTSSLDRKHRIKRETSYSHLFNGFAAKLPVTEIASLRKDPTVEAVYADTMLYPTAEVTPGVARMNADKVAGSKIGTGQAVDVDVAVLDTGVNAHADLNLVGSVDCAKDAGCTGTTAPDVVGHGTHVAGTIGAKDNGIGVVGTAPGARIWNVRVLAESGGYMSWFVAGLDWVAAKGDIEVVNASLGGGGSVGDAVSQAIDRATAAGVVVVVAAGNSNVDAIGTAPANAPKAITVSAYADTDGRPGRLGTTDGCFGLPDDSRASFSNFGSVVDVAAPGVCIASTSRSGGYVAMSGTSMASPHVAGAAATYIALKGTPKNANRWLTVLNAFKGEWGAAQSSTCGFTGGRSPEPVVMMGGCTVGGDTTPPGAFTLTGRPDYKVANLSWTEATDASGISAYRIYKAVGLTGTFALKTTVAGSERSFADTALTNGTTYRYYATALDNFNNVTTSAVVTVIPKDTSAPAAPVLSTLSKDKAIDVSWTIPTDPSGIKAFRLYRSVSGGAFELRATGTSATKLYKDLLLVNGTSYSYYVVAVDGMDNASVNSNTVTVSPADTLAPSVPSPSVVAADGALTVKWPASSDTSGVASYTVLRGEGTTGALTEAATVTGLTWTDTGLTNGSTYRYQVKATDVVGNTSVASRIVSGSPKDLTAPAAVDITGNTGNPAIAMSAELAWTEASDPSGISGYRVFRSAGTGPYQMRGATSGTVRTFKDLGLASGTSYRYYVVALDKKGNTSAPSSTLSLTPQDTIAPRSATVTVTPMLRTAMIGWTALSDPSGIKSVQLYRSVAGGSFEQIGALRTNARSYSDLNLTSGTRYTYRLVVTDGAGNVSASADMGVVVR